MILAATAAGKPRIHRFIPCSFVSFAASHPHDTVFVPSFSVNQESHRHLSVAVLDGSEVSVQQCLDAYMQEEKRRARCEECSPNHDTTKTCTTEVMSLCVLIHIELPTFAFMYSHFTSWVCSF